MRPGGRSAHHSLKCRLFPVAEFNPMAMRPVTYLPYVGVGPRRPGSWPNVTRTMRNLDQQTNIVTLVRSLGQTRYGALALDLDMIASEWRDT